LLGILLFLIPIPTDEGWNVTIAVLADLMAGSIDSFVPWVVLAVLVVAAVGSLLFIGKKENTSDTVPFFEKLFNVNLFSTLTRVVAAVFAFMVLFQVGPEPVWNENTGGLLLSGSGLLSFLFTIFLF